MNRAQIIILVLFIGGAGAAFYFYEQKKKKALADAAAQQAAAAAASQVATLAAQKAFCNPVLTSTSVIDQAAEKFNIQYKLAMQAWDAQGRGSDPNYFFTQYKIQMGCP